MRMRKCFSLARRVLLGLSLGISGESKSSTAKIALNFSPQEITNEFF